MVPAQYHSICQNGERGILICNSGSHLFLSDADVPDLFHCLQFTFLVHRVEATLNAIESALCRISVPFDHLTSDISDSSQNHKKF
jgi:hypothetical protein